MYHTPRPSVLSTPESHGDRQRKSPRDSLRDSLQRLSEIFGQPLIPLCVPAKGGGCRFISSGHGPDCPHPGKVPLVKGCQAPDWKLSPEQLEKYLRIGVNWGIRLGDGLVELDFDDPTKYQEFIATHALPEDTPVVLTGRKGGGYKLLLRAKKPPLKNFPHNGFEVRSRGHVVIPPSLHKTGKCYRWLRLNGCVPEVDLEELLGISFEEQKKTKGERSPLTTEQQKIAEQLLKEYLPGARYISGQLAGYLDPNSQSQAHVKVDIEKGVYYDFRKSKGGTIVQLLRLLGVPIPRELGGMGENGTPEFFPIWAIGRHWKEMWNCGEPIPVARKDGVPIWSGRAFCLQWHCPECAIRLKNILKARLKILPLEVWKAPKGAQAKLAKLKRKHKALRYARAINKDANYVLVRVEDKAEGELEASGFTRSDLKPNDVIDGLPYAPVGRRQKRFIPSRNFFDVAINILTPPKRSNNINCDIEGKKEVDEMAEKHEFDIVVYRGDYDLFLGRLRAKGFQVVDTSGGEGVTHRLIPPDGPPSRVDPEELGEVVEIITLQGVTKPL